MVRTILWVAAVWTVLAVVVSLALGRYLGGRRSRTGLAHAPTAEVVEPDALAHAEPIAS